MNEMIERSEYLERIKPFVGKPVVKVVTGLRRCGKSVFVRQLMERFKSNAAGIVYVDKESLDFDFITTYVDLDRYVSDKAKSIAGRVVVVVDEIQDVKDWEKAVASWSGKPEKYDVYITGSNSMMFSGALATKLTGRYVEMPIYPFSFCEFIRGFAVNDLKKGFRAFAQYGGLPGLLAYGFPRDETSLPYLDAVHDSIVLKDIVDRCGVRNVGTLRNIVRFVYDSIGSSVSALRISKYLKGQKFDVNLQTTVNYLRAIEEAQLVCGVERYDIKGKRLLEMNRKYYATDVGLRNAVVGWRAEAISHIVENIVYLELIRRGFKVSVGMMGDYEVDFVAERRGIPHYYQVTMSLDDPAVMDRETRSLLTINDNFPKTIIAFRPPMGETIQGLETVSLLEWLQANNG